ncbi:MAG: alkaline phosphatase family protein [Candidatus Binatia bacterium]
MSHLRALVLLLVAGLLASADAAERPHVYLVIVDGLDAAFVSPASMPRLYDTKLARHAMFLDACAVMPARTNPNHATLLTGAYAGAHGITGNAWWDRRAGSATQKLDDAALIEVETLYTVAGATRPELVTMGVFGKPKLGRLFAAAPGRQRAPTVLWSADQAARADRDPVTGYGRDAATIAALLDAAADREPDLAVVNLADVDGAAHGAGPDTVETRAAVQRADRALGRLIDDLRARGRWERSVVIVTADHGFAAVAPTGARPDPTIVLAERLADAGVTGVHVAADGGVAHVYGDPARDAGALARVAETVRGMPGIAETLARVPVAGVPLLASVHPDWKIDHPRTGELLLVSARGWQFVERAGVGEAVLRGNHGGPDERRIPLVVLGGWPGLRDAAPGTPSPSAADVAPTIALLLGLRAPRRVDGGEVPEDLVGRPIRAVLADDAIRDRSRESTR